MQLATTNETDLNEIRYDYERWLVEYGFSHEFVRVVVEDLSDHIAMPPEFDTFELRASAIHGQGLFATHLISAGELIAPARIARKRTHAGRLTNHSIRPNAKFTRKAEAADSDMDMVATRLIDAGEEVLVDYRQASSENGNGIRPDRAKSIETVVLRLHRSGFTGVTELELEHFLTGVLLATGYIPSDLVSWICAGRINNMAEHVGYLRAGLFVGKMFALGTVAGKHPWPIMP